MQNASFNVKKSTLEFVNALEQHISHTNIFYDDDFLDLILHYYPFENVALTVYEQGFKFIGGLARNDAQSAGEYFVNTDMCKVDYVAQYIAASYDRLEREECVILSSQVPSPNQQSEASFLKFLQVGNLKYAAILPVARSFRIVAYKRETEGDFNDEELTILKELLIISRNKYQCFKNLEACKNLSKIKSKVLDQMRVGYITLNQGFCVVDCNAQAIQHLTKMWGTTHIQNIIAKIRETIPEMNLDGGQAEYNGHTITSFSYSELDYYGRLQRYYYFTIMESAPCKQMCIEERTSASVSSLQFSLLSAREMEVLDAFAHGLEYKEISELLFISEGTVRTHLKSIYRKLDVSN